MAVVLAGLVAGPQAARAATGTYLPACSAVNIRTSASLGAAIKTRLTPSDTVTVVATVSGSSWSAVCPTAKSGSGWYRISAVNGTSVRTLYGVSYLYGATGVLKAAPAPAPTPAATPAPTPTPAPSATPSPTPTPAPAANLYLPACSAVNIRTSASLGAAIKTRLTPSDTVTVVATVSGSSWSAVCPTAKSGSGWYRISAVNGTSVRTLYGVSYLYGATGVLKAAPAPAPTPAATPAPTPTPAPAPPRHPRPRRHPRRTSTFPPAARSTSAPARRWARRSRPGSRRRTRSPWWPP